MVVGMTILHPSPFLTSSSKRLQRGLVYKIFDDTRTRPVLGRFLQPDPIGFKGSKWNLYRNYFGTSRTDPTGKCPDYEETATADEGPTEEVNDYNNNYEGDWDDSDAWADALGSTPDMPEPEAGSSIYYDSGEQGYLERDGAIRGWATTYRGMTNEWGSYLYQNQYGTWSTTEGKEGSRGRTADFSTWNRPPSTAVSGSIAMIHNHPSQADFKADPHMGRALSGGDESKDADNADKIGRNILAVARNGDTLEYRQGSSNQGTYMTFMPRVFYGDETLYYFNPTRPNWKVNE